VRLVPQQNSAFNRRFAVELDDGAVVESVLYREHTLCVSCQVGCVVGCPFCASGRPGLLRNLRHDEMVEQVRRARDEAPGLRRVTISGVGEPLHNADVVGSFIRWCRDERLAPSVTTSGGPTVKLRALFDLPHNGLTISVHAGTEGVRRRLVPRGPTLDALCVTVADGVRELSRSRRRRVSLAYLLLEGWNDGDEETAEFARRAKQVGTSVYLYRLNRVPGGAFRPASELRYQEVYEAWRRAGLEVRRSSLARVEDNGGCGTLLAFGASTGE